MAPSSSNTAGLGDQINHRVEVSDGETEQESAPYPRDGDFSYGVWGAGFLLRRHAVDHPGILHSPPPMITLTQTHTGSPPEAPTQQGGTDEGHGEGHGEGTGAEGLARVTHTVVEVEETDEEAEESDDEEEGVLSEVKEAPPPERFWRWGRCRHHGNRNAMALARSAACVCARVELRGNGQVGCADWDHIAASMKALLGYPGTLGGRIMFRSTAPTARLTGDLLPSKH
uniref:Uncharacterized protein n=1 Tax=Knipowitschia caucasica TaxID=637954 RepID=A0AAV2J1E4_KNICA